jgi:hypothetical protein
VSFNSAVNKVPKKQMAIDRPYHRTCRQFIDGSYANGGQWMYVVHPAYAKSPEHYVRAFLLIQDDLQSLFQYVEPADKNRQCYSFRIHELLLRTCIEIEANCKAILVENGYDKDEPTMRDFYKINASHRLSEYESRMPNWHGNNEIRKPFIGWRDRSHLEWYQAYNRVKHNRHHAFEEATLDNLINAFCALHVILSAQFYNTEFRPSD